MRLLIVVTIVLCSIIAVVCLSGADERLFEDRYTCPTHGEVEVVMIVWRDIEFPICETCCFQFLECNKSSVLDLVEVFNENDNSIND